MSQIWYAAFSEDFVEQAQQIFKKLDKDVIVTVWDPELVPEMLRRGVSVIFEHEIESRGIRHQTAADNDDLVAPRIAQQYIQSAPIRIFVGVVDGIVPDYSYFFDPSPYIRNVLDLPDVAAIYDPALEQPLPYLFGD